MQLVLKFIISLYIIILISVIATDILNSSTNNNIDETNKKEKKTTCEKIIEYSKHAKGTPYVWGGESLSGMDCSGFIHWMSIQLDSPVPRTTSQRYYLST
ncbi:MAG: NlpC/P60 family protein, partial [bacterium]